MGLLDTEEEKQASLDKKQKLKDMKDLAKQISKNQEQDVLAYEMGVSITNRQVFSKWMKKNHDYIAPIIYSFLGGLIACGLFIMYFKVV